MEQMQERRLSKRLLCADLVEVIWIDPAGRERRRIANLEDISQGGMCLQMEAALQIGTHVRLPYGTGELVGLVRYSQARDGAYFVGVQLDESSPWSTNQFRPQHILDPFELTQSFLLRHVKRELSKLVH